MANEQNVDLDQDMTLEQVKEQLVDLGKKRGVLSYKEIMEKMSFFDQEPQQMDEFFEALTEQGIEVVGDGEDDDLEYDQDNESSEENHS